jgi:hypothetical protein
MQQMMWARLMTKGTLHKPREEALHYTALRCVLRSDRVMIEADKINTAQLLAEKSKR